MGQAKKSDFLGKAEDFHQVGGASFSQLFIICLLHILLPIYLSELFVLVFKKEILLSVNNPVFGPVTVVSKRIDSAGSHANADRCISLLDNEKRTIGNAVYNVRKDHVYIYNIGSERKNVGVGKAISAIIAHYEKKPVELVAESAANRKIFERMGYAYLETVRLTGRKGYRMRLPVNHDFDQNALEQKLLLMGIPKAD